MDNNNQILELTKKLISYKTINGNDKEIVRCFDFIKQFFAKEIKTGRIIVREYRNNNLISVVFSNTKTLKYDIILNGHIDVVSAENKLFTPLVKDDKLFGRGAADMKSQVAVLMAVFKEVINSGIDKSIALMLTSDEEIGGQSGVGYLVDKIGYKSKVVIAPDGGHNFELIIKEKGGFWIKITAAGKLVHGSRNWLGENAIEKLIIFYQALLKIFVPLKKIKALYQDGISVNLGRIQGGKSINAVPDQAEMYLDIRYSEKSDKIKIIKKIEQLARKHKVSFEVTDIVEMLEVSSNDQYLLKFKNIAEEIIGKKIEISKATGASDARFFSAKNMPVIIMVPNCGNKHGNDEWVEIKSLGKFYEIIKKYIEEI